MSFFYGNIFLFVSFILFLIGLLGVIFNLKNMIKIILSLEIMLLAINLNFIIFSILNDDLVGQVFALYILTIAAAETSIGLSLIVRLFRIRGYIKVTEFNNLKH